MKLKLVVASMSILGLISCPVFAATQTETQSETQTTQTTTHHKHHHRHHHKAKHHHHQQQVQQQVASAPAVETETVAEAPAPTASSAGTPAPATSPVSAVLAQVSQNVGRAMPAPEWFNRIGIAGGANVDMGKWGGSRALTFTGQNYQRVSLNDAYLNVTGTVNDWATVFTSISYNDASDDVGGRASITTGFLTEKITTDYSEAYNSGALSLEQGYVTIGNFDVSPFYVQLGKQYQDFGRYEIHPITRPMTQVLSESLQTSAKIGFVLPTGFQGWPVGFNGSIYAMDVGINKAGTGGTATLSDSTNFGAALGLDHPDEELGYDLGVGYLYNMLAANDVLELVGNIGGGAFATPTYHNTVGALAVYGDVNSGPFSLNARYTTALNRFSVLDLPLNGLYGTPSTSGGQPWAAGLQAGYAFNFWDRNHNIYLGYQATDQAASLLLPLNRWTVGYNMDAWKYTNFGVQWDYDQDYSVGSGGTGNSTSQVSLRAAVKFG